MYYTIDNLLLDEGKSLDPNDYSEHTIIGNQLVAFMTAHLGQRTWKVGGTTAFGHHSFMLSIEPTVEVLRFWLNAQEYNWRISPGCSGSLVVVDEYAQPRIPPKGLHTPEVNVKKKSRIQDFIKNRFK